jgi:2-dehydropantoate 2-reductase
MDTWYLTHLALVCPLANAIYLDGGDNYSLSKNRNALKLLVKTLKESLHYVNHSQRHINPARFKFLILLPEIFLVKLVSWILNSRWAGIVISAHCHTAKTEMDKLSKEFASHADESGYKLPNFKKIMNNDPIDQKIEKLLWISSILFNWSL